MKKTTANAIVNLAYELGLLRGQKKLYIIFNREEDAREERPNAFVLMAGGNGYTCAQDSYWFKIHGVPGKETYILKDDNEGDFPYSNLPGSRGSWHKVQYREYTDKEIGTILKDIRKRGMKPESRFFDNWYIINK